MQDKIVIITGASDGIGKATARILREQKAYVVIVGRSLEKTKALAQELDSPYFVADFSKLDDVRKLGRKLKETYPRIDVLMNNAGGIFNARELTVDGFEKTMQVNHLAHFLLTNILLDNLIASKPIVINTSSVANQYLSKLDVDDLNMEKKHSRYSAYGNAKLENILFTKEFHRRYGKTGISMAAFHPGTIATNFAAGSSGIMRLVYQTPLRKVFGLLTVEEGVDTGVWLATTKPGRDWQPGEYYYKRKITKTHKFAYDETIAKSVWEQSERMVNANYPVV